MWNPAAKLSSDLLDTHIKINGTKDGYGEAVKELGKDNQNIVVLSADLTISTRSNLFKEAFPERFIAVGVAEQNMAGIAAGLALNGKIPFMASFATFSPGRNWEQIRVAIAYSKANVKIIGGHSGLSDGPDGATHQGLEDIALTRVLPNMVILAPSDYLETKKAVYAAAKHIGPVYIRTTREPTPVFTTEHSPFEIGKATILKKGTALTIISAGPIMYEVLRAVKDLENHGIDVEVINSPSIKPLDDETIINSAQKTKKVLTVEEHQAAGGLGSAIAELLSEKMPVKIKRLGMQDTFGESGDYKKLWDKYGISANHIIIAAKEMYHAR